MDNNKLKKILNYFHDELKPEIDKYYAQDCCVAATRIVLDVLEHFKIPARPVTTQLIVFNEVYYQAHNQWIKKYGQGPMDEKQIKETQEAGGYAIGVGYPGEMLTKTPTNGQGFAGHLIAIADESFFIDLSITQVHRSQHNILVSKPFIARINPEENMVFTYEEENGDVRTYLFYKVIENNDYLNAPDWTNERRRIISDKTIVRLNGANNAASLRMRP